MDKRCLTIIFHLGKNSSYQYKTPKYAFSLAPRQCKHYGQRYKAAVDYSASSRSSFDRSKKPEDLP
uniref:Uncharacterized protein n=1 Tax=Romanomermis culicivorax TaxID=13658 RepID=A0A915K3U8_ROMCU